MREVYRLDAVENRKLLEVLTRRMKEGRCCLKKVGVELLHRISGKGVDSVKH